MTTPQETKNAEWLQTSAGITFITAPRVDTSLRKPYGHILSMQKLSELVSDARRISKTDLLQFDGLSVRTLAYGKKLNIFLLGFCPGYCGDDRGVSEVQWDEICTAVDAAVRKHIPSAITYKEPWTKDRKFQFRWEAYVMIEELQPQYRK